MENLIIVPIATSEISRLQKIGKETFIEAFAAFNTEENMRDYLESSFSIANLLKEVETKLSQFFFAMVDNVVVGYMKLNTGDAQTDLKDANALEIERIWHHF